MYELGTAYYQQDNYSNAIVYLEKAVAANPEKYSNAYFRLGYCKTRVEDYDAAIHYYGKAIEEDPNYGLAYNNLGYAYILKGSPREAIAPLEKAIELEPQNRLAYVNMGDALEAIGKSRRARKYYSQAEKLN